MRKGRVILFLIVFISFTLILEAQRVYSPHSVLSSGSWFRISVRSAGIYRVDLALLNSLGMNTANLSSSSIRLFGNGGHLLPEANSAARPDDLTEVAIEVFDGGDGILNGNDYFIFYAPGPDKWIHENQAPRFSHVKNIYSDKAYYFITFGGNGKRISLSPLISSATVQVNSFSERYFHEIDSVNFLSGGKEWYGEELSSLPGRTLTKNFLVNTGELVPNSAVEVRSALVSRSAGVASRFDIRINNSVVNQSIIPAIAGGLYDVFANQAIGLSAATSTGNNVDISFTYVPGSFNAQGWINWFELFTRRKLMMAGSAQLLFRDWNSVGNPTAEFIIQQAVPSLQVWDITDFSNPVRMQGQFQNNEWRFIAASTMLREYIAFNLTNFLIPTPEGKINNQDLHNTSPVDYIIIAHPSLLNQASRLASLHQAKNNLRTLVISTDQVFNEFSSGTRDPSALRDFVKMYFDKYGTNPADKISYLLLFGDGSFDYKDRLTNNTNLVPVYQNSFSLDPLSTYTSDDFYGFLEDQEDINSGLVLNLLDVGIGRVPAKNEQEAKNFVDKVEAYLSAKSFGHWRNNLSFVADDEDQNMHVQDAEIVSATSKTVAPIFNQQKIYLDAYRQQGGGSGSRYPEVEQGIVNQMFNGILIWNYTGHGGAKRLAEETILDQSLADQWNNSNRLPLIITATCDFAPYDNPGLQSLGESLLLRPQTGAIALMTTTRVVFAFSNRVMNDNYLKFALQRDANGKYRSLGEAVKDAKNYTYQTFQDITNNRKFTLLGDPALTIGLPYYQVNITSVNGTGSSTDTLSAGENAVVEGDIRDLNGSVRTSFNGTMHTTVFDKPQLIRTLANDPGSMPMDFMLQENILFRGKATVQNGRFSIQFKIPKDINYQFGNGKISLYATDSVSDGNGSFTNFIIGGTGINTGDDKQGPDIRVYLNDEMFVNGGLTNPDPLLLIKLKDSSGINTTKTGVGHELVATLDNDNRQYFILNDFYEAGLDSYQEGIVRFPLPAMTPGKHSIRIKAWDVMNNSAEAVLDFVVGSEEELELSHVLNYPNPFTSLTSFWFEHNKPGELLHVQLQIMTVTGRVIRSFSEKIQTTGNRSTDLRWDGRDNAGDRAARGVYIYELKVSIPGKKPKKQRGKLVLL